MKTESGSPCIGPDRRDLFALILAVVIGLAIGPMVMGRFAPDLYDYLFVGSGKSLVEEVDPAVDENREKLAESGASEIAGIEHDQQQAKEQAAELEQAKAINEETVQKRRIARQMRFTLLMHGMMMATAAVMIFEVLTGWFTGLRGRAFRVRLIQSRYLLMSGWLILFFAQPTMYLDISPWFVILLLSVILASGIFALLRSGKITAEMKVTM